MAVKKASMQKASMQKASMQQLPEFTKEQLLRSKKYRNRRDLLNALLDDEESYTMDAVDDLIQRFYKKEQVK